MRWKKTAVAAFVAVATLGCTDRTPTGVAPGSEAALAKGGGPVAAAKRAALLTNISISAGSFSGTLSITHIGYDAVNETLLFSGTVTSEGVTDTFTDVAGTLTHDAGSSVAQFGPNEPGKCDLLFLDIGPISLDLLGLELDLSPIQLDLDADPGPGNLLGNLLCAVAGLLDLGGLLGFLEQLNQLLDLINDILGAVS